MSAELPAPLTPPDLRAMIAVDLGAESCRVSLLRWKGNQPEVELVHRFPNHARMIDGHLRWDLTAIQAGVEEGLRRAAVVATEGVASLAVDGWAVDYVRLNRDGVALAEPFCYRDERTIEAERQLHERISPLRMQELTGVQLLRINTVYQIVADRLMGLPEGSGWQNLPEYLLSRWGGQRVAEMTNATHTQMVERGRAAWCGEIFSAAGAKLDGAMRLVPPGTAVGQMQGPLTKLPSLREVQLIAPACHDTASAVAGIPAEGEDWAYVSSGTWSLVGTVLAEPCTSEQAAEGNFTNLAGVGGATLFHRNVNGMWLLRQCMEYWEAEGVAWEIEHLIQAAAAHPRPERLLDVDAPELLLAGRMPARLNAQLRRGGGQVLSEESDAAPAMASLVLHSLAARYAEVLGQIERHTGRRFKRVYVVGGGSRNELLNHLTAQAAGLAVVRGSPESSTIGNFAVQLATREGRRSETSGAEAKRVAEWAAVLCRATHPLQMRTA